jgi:hypothetical protein
VKRRCMLIKRMCWYQMEVCVGINPTHGLHTPVRLVLELHVLQSQRAPLTGGSLRTSTRAEIGA